MKLTVKITNVNYRDMKKNFYICKISIIKNTNSVFRLKNTTLFGNTTETLCKNDVIEIDANFNKSKNCLDLVKIISRSNGENEALLNFFVENTEKISKSTFQKIFKNNSIDEIVNNPTLLDSYRLGKSKKESILNTIKEYKKRTEIHHFAIVSGFSIEQANKIYDIYEDNFYSILENPYKLYFSKILTWKECDLLHIKWNLKEEIREKSLLSKQIYDYCANGNTCIPKDEIENRILLDEMLKDGTYKEYKNCIYFKKIYDIERQLEKRIKEISKNENDGTISTTQEEAIQNALIYNISIITGGPGTGKTYTINKIVEELEKRHFSYCLTAPTGKAADRMSELTKRETYTIHRKLGLTVSEYSEPKEINEDYIIIDEFSMIDIELANVLFDNISDHTKIIIVGDINQLPSVGLGNILNDLIYSNLIKTTKLSRVYRQQQNSGILENSYNIIEEKDINFSYNDFKFINSDDIDFIQDYIIKNYNKDTTQILAAQHEGQIGTNAINLLIQNKQDDDDEQRFKIGDKVIQTINNYDLEIFNGNIGTIEEIRQEVISGELQNIIKVNFENVNKIIEYDNSNSKELDLAYALTIHKSQGSEFQRVIIPILSSDEFLLYKNLIYTGITRSKKECILIGDFDTFEKCRKKNIHRVSNLLK